MALKKKTYKIKSGDTLSQIAKDMGMSLSALKQANPKIENVNKIKVGQTINIPSLANIKGSKDPYKGMTKDMMSKMDVKNKDMAKQKEASRKLGLRGLSPNQTSGKSMTMPKPKPKAEIAKRKKVAERLKKLAARSANKNGTTMAMPKPKPKTQTASRTSRRKGRKA
jgi:LysM repeat protein